MTKILFLDLDGTVRRTKSGAKFINDPYDQELIPGVQEAIARYPEHWIIGITNQGGVAAGKKSVSDCVNEQMITSRMLMQVTDKFCGIFFCTDYDGNDCFQLTSGLVQMSEKIDWEHTPTIAKWKGLCRKPDPGMVEIALAMLEGEINRSECLFVGDRNEDQECAKNANIPFMWAHDWRK